MAAALPTPDSEEPRREWEDLTHVCLLNVLSRLSLEDRWKGASLACKPWLLASKDPSLFTTFDLEPRFDSSRDSPRWWTPEFERKIDSMLRSAAECGDVGLVEVRVRHCSDRALLVLAERAPNLQVLSIKSCPNVTDMSLGKIAIACKLLTELNISFCYEISYKSLEIIGINCPRLKILKRNHMNWPDPSQYKGIVPNDYVNAVPQDGDREAQAIANNMKNLHHLELHFSNMTSIGLSYIAKECEDLEFLDLSGCVNLTSRSMEEASTNLKNLKRLVKPNFFIPRSTFNMERYGHWQLYDERFQTGAFIQL